jgi:hypothetical protein
MAVPKPREPLYWYDSPYRRCFRAIAGHVQENVERKRIAEIACLRVDERACGRRTRPFAGRFSRTCVSASGCARAAPELHASCTRAAPELHPNWTEATLQVSRTGARPETIGRPSRGEAGSGARPRVSALDDVCVYTKTRRPAWMLDLRTVDRLGHREFPRTKKPRYSFTTAVTRSSAVLGNHFSPSMTRQPPVNVVPGRANGLRARQDSNLRPAD